MAAKLMKKTIQTAPVVLPPTIDIAMAAITRDIEAITKVNQNKDQKWFFRGIDDVYNALHPIFAAHGVTCRPISMHLETTSPGVNSKGNAIWRSVVKITYRFSASDGSHQDAEVVGEGMDYSDKATAKSLSMAHKYLLLQTFLIPTADIVDQDYYDPTVMPREQLRLIEEERAKAAVMAGGEMDLPESQAAALAEKKASMTGGLPPGATKVDCKPLPPVEEPPQEPKKRTRKAVTGAEPPPEPEVPAETQRPATEAKSFPKGSWQDYTIVQIHMVEYEGKKLGDLNQEQIEFLKVKWVDRYAAKIALNPEKQAEANRIMMAHAHYFAHYFPKK